MIPINLLRRPSPGKKPKTRLPRWFVRVVLMSVIGIAIVVVGVEIMQWWITGPSIRFSLLSKKQKENEGAGTSANAAPAEGSNAAAKPPSVGGATATASANKMSGADSVRCKIAFAHRVLAAFSDGLPADVSFTGIAIDSFSHVSAEGLVGSRESAGNFFAALPGKKFNLYPPPRTYIRPNGSQGFRFRIESSFAFAADAETDSPQGSVPAWNLHSAMTGFSDVCTGNGIALSRPLTATASGTGGACSSSYSFAGSGAYSDFVALVHDLYKRHIPCAFRSIRLTAAQSGAVAITAEVAFFVERQSPR